MFCTRITAVVGRRSSHSEWRRSRSEWPRRQRGLRPRNLQESRVGVRPSCRLRQCSFRGLRRSSGRVTGFPIKSSAPLRSMVEHLLAVRYIQQGVNESAIKGVRSHFHDPDLMISVRYRQRKVWVVSVTTVRLKLHSLSLHSFSTSQCISFQVFASFC